MGNTNSTTQPVAPAARLPRAGLSPKPKSPFLSTDGTPLSAKTKVARRRKSIELSDVDTSLSFTSPTGQQSAGRKARRHHETLDNISGDEEEGTGGTLRGAMQGRAEHVVYGPRRDDTLLQANPLGAVAARPLPTSTISLPSTHTPMIDPDHTSHPGFQASPRLTSAVLLSSERMPVLVSPATEEFPPDSPFGGAHATTGRKIEISTTSLSGAVSSIAAPFEVSDAKPAPPHLTLLPPHTSAPYPPINPPTNSILAPMVPSGSLPISADKIPSGTSVIPSPPKSPSGSTCALTPRVLLPPSIFNSPVSAIPIPILSVPSATIAASLLAAAVDLGAGADGVPTLIKWKNEDGQMAASEGKKASGPREVFVTGTFSNGWKTKIELRRTDPSDFSALISLPPGPHRLKFIVDKEWKASKHLPVATDADGNLINYLYVSGTASKATANLLDWSSTSQGTVGGASSPSFGHAMQAPSSWSGIEDTQDDSPDHWEVDEEEWTNEIPAELVEWGEWESEREAIESGYTSNGGNTPPPSLPPPPASSGVPPPTLPAQLEKGPLNHAAYVTQGSGDDNSILPKPDHSVINHLAASPIKGGFLSVGVTTRYKRKFVTIVYYKALNP